MFGRFRGSNGRWGMVAFGLFALMFASACADVEGTLVTSGAPFGDTLLDFKDCRTGEHHQFHGVVLIPKPSQKGGIIAIRDVKTGDLVKVELPESCDAQNNCRFELLTPNRCSTFDLTLERSKKRVNLIWLMNGSLDLVCDLDGATAEAHVVFEDCG